MSDQIGNQNVDFAIDAAHFMYFSKVSALFLLEIAQKDLLDTIRVYTFPNVEIPGWERATLRIH